jgi:hypothetical protein
VGALNDAQIWSHTIYIYKLLNLQLHPSPLVLCLEQVVCLSNPKNGPFPHEHARQGPHVALVKAPLVFVHLSTP